MKACKVMFSVEWLLNQIGLEGSSELLVYHAEANPEGGTVTLSMTGTHPGLPEVKMGEEVPLATLQAKRIESKLTIV